MADFPFLPIYTDAFIGDTTHLNAEETGAYLMLIFTAWRSPTCSLPDDDVKLARSARVAPGRWAKIKPTVMSFWTLSEGAYTQKRLTATRDGVSKRANAARANGKAGGRPKSLKNNDPANPVGSSGVCGSEPSKTKTKSNIETLPRLREPEGPTATRLDPAWELDQALFDVAIAEGLARDRVTRAAAQFRDWHLDRGSVSFDWHAAWRRWCRNEIERPRSGSPPPGQPPSGGGRREPRMSAAAQRLSELHDQLSEAAATGALHVPSDAIDADELLLLAGPEHDEAGSGAPDGGAGGARGEDRGVAWAAGGGSRPSDALLRAVGQGGHDTRASSALRRRKAPDTAA